MLEGKKICLRIVEKEDIPLLSQWFNDAEFQGEYQDYPTQISQAQLEKQMFEPQLPQIQWVNLIIEKKDGTKTGWMAHYISSQNFGWMEIGCALLPNERGKGYGTEAVQLMVDYLFLTREGLERIQAVTNVSNSSFQRALGRVGFTREGTLRKALFMRGKWANGFMYSILREEWKEPKILTKTDQQRREKNLSF